MLHHAWRPTQVSVSAGVSPPWWPRKRRSGLDARSAAIRPGAGSTQTSARRLQPRAGVGNSSRARPLAALVEARGQLADDELGIVDVQEEVARGARGRVHQQVGPEVAEQVEVVGVDVDLAVVGGITSSGPSAARPRARRAHAAPPRRTPGWTARACARRRRWIPVEVAQAARAELCDTLVDVAEPDHLRARECRRAVRGAGDRRRLQDGARHVEALEEARRGTTSRGSSSSGGPVPRTNGSGIITSSTSGS